jgi:nitrogen regulatory protein P-II 1
MRLLLIVLNKEELLDDFVQGLLEADVRGATILDSVGMGRILSQDLPIFAGLKGLLSGNRPHNKTILTAVNEDQEEKVAEVFREIVGPFNEPGNGLIISLPVHKIYGMGQNS